MTQGKTLENVLRSDDLSRQHRHVQCFPTLIGMKVTRSSV